MNIVTFGFAAGFDSKPNRHSSTDWRVRNAGG